MKRYHLRLSGSAGCTIKSIKSRAFTAITSRKTQYGFIGLGQMGYSMAKTLQGKLTAQDTLKVFDINARSLERFAYETKLSSGATVIIAANAPEAAETSETIVTVLPETSHVQDVYSRILQKLESSRKSANRDRLFIDCSTIDPTASRGVAKAVHASGKGNFVDAPMSGGVAGATTGSLTFMLGSPDHLVSRTERILLLMGKKVWHCGPQGSGLFGKLANNYLLAINNIATAEAMNLGIRWGIDPKLLSNLINSSTGRCWPSEVNNPVDGVVDNSPASRDYAGGFGLGLMKKDLTLAILGANRAGVRLVLGERAREVYEAVNARDNCKGRDFSVVYRYLQEDDE